MLPILYERYVSNLLTQNVAMLYTAEGKVFYFSMNLSEDQLRLLGSALSSGGGSSGGAGSSGGSGSRGQVAGQASSPVSKQQVADALEGAMKNPFDGFKTESRGLQVSPQATILPPSFGVQKTATYVPFDFKIPTRSQSRSVASGSSSKRTNKISPSASVAVSANPSLAMMGLTRTGSRIGGATASGSGGGSSFKSSGTSVSSKAIGIPANSKTNAGSPVYVAKASKSDVEGVTGPQGPVGIRLADPTNVRKLSGEFSCKPGAWSNVIYSFNKNEQAEGKSCIPDSATQICGSRSRSTEDYKNTCMEKDTNLLNCYAQMKSDIRAICDKYMSSKDTNLIQCAEVLSALACNKIPCDLSLIKVQDEVQDEKAVEIVDINVDFRKNATGEVPLFKNSRLIPYDKISELLHFDSSLEFKAYKKPDEETELKRQIGLKEHISAEKWVPTSEVDFNIELRQLSLFLELSHNNPDVCSEKENSISNDSSQ